MAKIMPQQNEEALCNQMHFCKKTIAEEREQSKVLRLKDFHTKQLDKNYLITNQSHHQL